MTGNESTTFTFFPTIAICCGRSYLKLAIVTSMTNTSAFSATTQRSRQTASSTFENVLKMKKESFNLTKKFANKYFFLHKHSKYLINMFSSSPCETARIVATSNK